LNPVNLKHEFYVIRCRIKKHIGDVLDDEYSLGMYATDASHYQVMPIAVILPKDESEVKKRLKLHGIIK
jgi:hypothetical protein